LRGSETFRKNKEKKAVARATDAARAKNRSTGEKKMAALCWRKKEVGLRNRFAVVKSTTRGRL